MTMSMQLSRCGGPLLGLAETVTAGGLDICILEHVMIVRICGISNVRPESMSMHRLQSSGWASILLLGIMHLVCVQHIVACRITFSYLDASEPGVLQVYLDVVLLFVSLLNILALAQPGGS